MRKLIELFVMMGCRLEHLPGRAEGLEVRFLYNPDADTFASLSNLDDDDLVGPSEIDYFERPRNDDPEGRSLIAASRRLLA